MNKEKQVRVCLLATFGIGRRTFRKVENWLKQNHANWEDFWRDKSMWKLAELNENQIISLEKFQQKFGLDGYFNYLEKINVRVIDKYDNDYPMLLNNIDDQPIVLYIKGQIPEQKLPSISVVGTRKATYYGRLATEKIVKDLVGSRVTIVSGFMYGIDICAHEAALENAGSTIGVLGFGFEHFYPSIYRKKYLEMLEKGMGFMTEYAPFVAPKQGSFPERNRIVAGLSLGTVVIEAGENSGTLITSRLASEFGREVFAVPGSIFSPYSVGTKLLLSQGACLVNSGDEILSELNLKKNSDVFLELSAKVGGVVAEIIEELKLGQADFERLAKVSRLPTTDLNVTLSQMEIEGLVDKRGEAWVLRI